MTVDPAPATATATTTTYRISTGRGGAGNIRTADAQISPRLVPQGSQTPNILQPVFSTGRGGAGNMRRNVDAKLTRRAQDVDVDDDDVIACTDEDYIGPIASSGEDRISNIATTMSAKSSGGGRARKVRTKGSEPRPKAIVLGRGGAGNIISPTSSKRSNKKKEKKSANKGFWSSLKRVFS